MRDKRVERERVERGCGIIAIGARDEREERREC
jgi:hypothetical protein